MLQRLNLTLPEREKNVAVLDTCASEPDAAEEIDLRAKLILDAGQVPDLLYVCGDKNKYVAVEHPQAKSSRTAALHHAAMRPGIICGLCTSRTMWDMCHSMRCRTSDKGSINSGIQAFALNRCFRCGVTAPLRMQVLLEREAFRTLWARDRAARWYRGEHKFSEFIEYQKRGDARARRTLEYIRDHIDCGTPYLYELIAFRPVSRETKRRRARLSNGCKSSDRSSPIGRSKWGGPGMSNRNSKGACGRAGGTRAALRDCRPAARIELSVG